MREEYLEKQKLFYKTCGEILGIEHKYKVPFARKTRWNDRSPGNGRYEGFGIIRRFSETLISVTSRSFGQKVLFSEKDVYEYLKEITGN